MTAETDEAYVDYLQHHIRDLRNVLETLHQSEPWVPRDDFKQAFTENDLGQLYDDMFGEPA